MGALRDGPSEGDLQYVRQALAARGGAQVPQNFTQTAPGHDGVTRRGRMPQSSPRNPQVRTKHHHTRREAAGLLLAWLLIRRGPRQLIEKEMKLLLGLLQTVAFLEMLGLPYNLDHSGAASTQGQASSAPAGESITVPEVRSSCAA